MDRLKRALSNGGVVCGAGWFRDVHLFEFAEDDSLVPLKTVCTGVKNCMRICYVASSADDIFVAVGEHRNITNDEPSHVSILGLASGQVITKFCNGHIHMIRALCPIPDTDLLASSNVWRPRGLLTNWRTGKLVAELPETMKQTYQFTFDRFSSRMFSGGQGDSWKSKSNLLEYDITGRAAAGCWTETGIPSPRLFDSTSRASILGLSCLVNHSALCTSGEDGTVRFWDRKTGQCVASKKFDRVLGTCFYTDDLRALFVGNFDGSILVFDPRNLEKGCVDTVSVHSHGKIFDIARLGPNLFASSSHVSVHKQGEVADGVGTWRFGGSKSGSQTAATNNYTWSMCVVSTWCDEYDSPFGGYAEELQDRSDESEERIRFAFVRDRQNVGWLRELRIGGQQQPIRCSRALFVVLNEIKP